MLKKLKIKFKKKQFLNFFSLLYTLIITRDRIY